MNLTSDRATRLTQVSTPVAAKATLHEMRMQNDVMSMRAVQSIEIPSGGHVTLDEKGLHVMLEGLRQPLKEGDHVPLELRFVDEKGATTTIHVEAPVRGLGASSGDK